jgi:glycosyltransferase involved in cell wall biosynthesis
MQSKKVLVIGARGIPDVEGGAEKNAEALFPLMAAAGYDVTVMGLRQFIKGEQYRGVQLLASPAIKFLNTDKIGYYLYAIYQVLKIRPDVVHLQGLGSAVFLLIYKILGCKTVVRYGSADYILNKWGILGRLGFLFAEWQLRFADAVISVTPALSERLAKRGIRKNVHMIPNALDPAIVSDTNLPLTSDRPFILSVGRVTYQKNVISLVNAFNRLSESHPDYDLVIAGGLDDEPYAEQLRPLLNDKVKLLGRVPRSSVPGLLKRSALYVNVSLHEGSSNATLEAISQGCSVLISDIPENKDMPLPGHHFVDPNDINAIAAKLTHGVENRQEYVVDKGNFLTWSNVAEKTIDVYQSLGTNRLEPVDQPVSA